MPFVDMPRSWLHAQLAQHTNTANAQHHFLLDAHFAIATVKLVGDVAIGFAVVGEIGIEEIQNHMASAGVPDLCEHRAARHIDMHDHFAAVGAQRGFDRQLVHIGILVASDLIAVTVDALMEITLAIEQAHSDKRQTHIARRFAMIAGENAQPAGINRKTFVEAVLGTKVGDQIIAQQPFGTVAPQRLVMIGIVIGDDLVKTGKKHLISRGVDQALFIHPSQEFLGIVVDGAE